MSLRLSLLLALFAAPAFAADVPPATRVTKTSWPKLFLTYTPDGGHFVYSRHYPNRRAANRILTGLRVVGADGSDDRSLMPEFDQRVQIQEHPAFGPDRKTLYLTGGGNDLGNAAKDAFVCEIGPDLRGTRLRKLLAGNGVTLGEQPVPSPDGKQLAFCSVGRVLSLADAAGKDKRILLQTAGNYLFQPAWSPDGEWIAFACDRDGDVELYKIRPDGTELTRLTKSPGLDCRPKWSPDAQWLVFTSNRAGNEDLYLMRADGSGVRRLTDHPAPDDHAAWSPDGRSLAFVSLRDGGFDIYTLPLPADVPIAKSPPKPAAPPLAGDLVAHFDFDGDDGDQIIDRATGRKTMTLTGARLVGPAGRRALSFESKGHFASCGNPPRVQISGPLTLTLWIRPQKHDGNGYLVSKYAWNLYLGPNLVPYFETRTSENTDWETLPAAAPAPAEKWTFLAAVLDPAAKEKRVYVNGVLSAKATRPGDKIGGATPFNLELGRYAGGGSQQYLGLMDEVRVYRRALTSKEIAEEFGKQALQVSGAAARPSAR